MNTIELVPYVRVEPLWRAVRSDPNLRNIEIHRSKYGILNIGPYKLHVRGTKTTIEIVVKKM